MLITRQQNFLYIKVLEKLIHTELCLWFCCIVNYNYPNYKYQLHIYIVKGIVTRAKFLYCYEKHNKIASLHVNKKGKSGIPVHLTCNDPETNNYASTKLEYDGSMHKVN